jgi:hypothetical protein
MRATGLTSHAYLLGEIQKIQEGLRELPNNVKNVLLEHFDINNQQVGRHELAQQLHELELRIVGLFDRNAGGGGGGAAAPAVVGGDAGGGLAAPERYTIFSWGGRFHHVPESFRFPTTPLKDIFVLWVLGKAVDGMVLAPYRMIVSKHDLKEDACRTNFSKAQHVILAFYRFSQQRIPDLPPLPSLQLQHIDNMFDRCYIDFATPLTKRKVRLGQITYGTLRNSL